MKILSIVLLLASAALNVCFFAGCKSLHDMVYGAPCEFGPAQPANDSGKEELVKIAGLLDIKTSGKTASDLSSDIRFKLERNVEVPAAFDATAFEKMEKDLRVEEKTAMRAYQQFISDLQGKRVIVVESEK